MFVRNGCVIFRVYFHLFLREWDIKRRQFFQSQLSKIQKGEILLHRVVIPSIFFVFDHKVDRLSRTGYHLKGNIVELGKKMFLWAHLHIDLGQVPPPQGRWRQI